MQSNVLQINIANRRNVSLDVFIEKYACKIRDLINAGLEDENAINSLLDAEETVH